MTFLPVHKKKERERKEIGILTQHEEIVRTAACKIDLVRRDQQTVTTHTLHPNNVPENMDKCIAKFVVKFIKVWVNQI